MKKVNVLMSRLLGALAVTDPVKPEAAGVVAAIHVSALYRFLGFRILGSPGLGLCAGTRGYSPPGARQRAPLAAGTL